MMHTTGMFPPSFLRHLLRLLYLSFTREQLALHRPFEKHELVSRDFDELFERDPDHEFFLRDVIDNDFFERFYDNLD